MAVDYLKTYLGIDPNDYSAMEARIRGEEPQARTPVMMIQPMMMPQQRSLGDIEAMQLIPRQQPAPQVDDRYQGLTDQIVALKSQIEGMQAPQPAPQVDDRYQGLMDQIAALRSQIDALQAPVVEEAPVMAPTPAVVEAPTPAPAVMSEPYQAPPEIENRMVGEPVPFVAQEPVLAPTPALDIPQAPAEDIQASINYLAGLPKMNIPQIPDIEQIKQKMAEANMNFPEPVSYPDQLQSIRDLPPMTQMPTREEIQMAMQNIPVPEKAFTPAQTIQEKIQMAMQNIPVPEKAFTPAQTIQEKIQMAIQNIPAPAPVFTPAQTIQEKIQAIMQNMPVPIQKPGPVFTPAQTIQEKIQAVIQNIPTPRPAPAPVFTPAQTIQEKIQAAIQNIPTPIPEPMVFPSIPKFSSPVPQMPTREEIQAIMQNIPAPAPVFTPAQTIQEKIQAAIQNIPTPTAPASSMPKFNLPQMQSFGLPQKIGGGRTLMSDFSPRNVMRMASGGGIDKAIYDLKFKLNGS
jgi:hypothetical protein